MRQWLPLVLHFRCLDGLLGRHTVRARGLMLVDSSSLVCQSPTGNAPGQESASFAEPNMLVRLCNSLHVSFVAHAPPSSSWSLCLSPHSSGSCYGALMVPWAARRRCAHAREQMSSSSSILLLLLLLLPPPPPPPPPPPLSRYVVKGGGVKE